MSDETKKGKVLSRRDFLESTGGTAASAGLSPGRLAASAGKAEAA